MEVFNPLNNYSYTFQHPELVCRDGLGDLRDPSAERHIVLSRLQRVPGDRTHGCCVQETQQ